MAHRPRLGARFIVKQYVQRYIKNLYKEITDWLESSRVRCSNLLVFSIIYTEEYTIQFLDNLFVALYKVVLEVDNPTVKKNVPLIFQLIGRYCLPKYYRQLIMSAIRNELASFYSYTQAGSIRAFGYLFEGSIELMERADEFERVEELLNDFIHYAKTELVDQLDMELASLTIETLSRVMGSLIAKAKNGVDPAQIIKPHLQSIFVVALKCLAQFQSFRLNNKPDPQNILDAKASFDSVLNQLQQLSDHPEKEYLVRGLPTVIDETFSACDESSLSGWAVQQPQYKLFFALCYLVSEKHLLLEVQSGISVFDELARILRGTMVNKEKTSNLKVKHLGCFTLFPLLTNKVKDIITPNESELLQGVLEEAMNIEWGGRDENFKYQNILSSQHDELCRCGGIRLKSIEHGDQFYRLVGTLRKIYHSKEATERTICQSLNTLREYMRIFNEQIVSQIPNNEERYEQLSKTTWLQGVTDDLIGFTKSYFDSVRDVCCLTMQFIGENFLTFNANLP